MNEDIIIKVTSSISSEFPIQLDITKQKELDLINFLKNIVNDIA